MAYGDVHRAMLQTLMCRKYMSEKDLIGFITNLWKQYNCEDAPPIEQVRLRGFFDAINQQIGRSGLQYAEIKRIRDNNEPTVYWGLASIENSAHLDPTSKETGHLDVKSCSDTELHLLKKIIEELVTQTKHEGRLDHNLCINMGMKKLPKPHSLSAEGATQCIDKFVQDGWLRVVEDVGGARGRHNAKRITLGILSLLDARAYILKNWPDAEERCCEWDNDWLFKWVGEPSRDDASEGPSQRNASSKRVAESSSGSLEGASGKRARAGGAGGAGAESDND